MKNSASLIKLFTISACFFVAHPAQAMVQNVLDYIQTYRKPVEKAVDYLLLTPRLLISDIEEAKRAGFYRHAIALAALMQSLAPGAYAMNLASWPMSMRLAIEKGNVGLVRGLLAHKADSDLLPFASRKLQPEIVKLFLDAGADINAKSTLGDDTYTAADFATIRPEDNSYVRSKKLEIQKILEEHKAQYAKQAQEAIETHATVPTEYRGSKEIAGIIKGYL